MKFQILLNHVKEYIKNINELKNDSQEELIKSVANVEEIQTAESKLNEYMILRLRLLEGVSSKQVLNKFNVDFFEHFKREIKKLTEEGLLEIEQKDGDKLIRLSQKGLDLANIVWEEFI